MDIPNAFIGKADQPIEEELTSALGSSAPAWKELVSWLAAEHDVTGQEWKCYSPKHGWSVQLKLKKRTIVHLAPCIGCFRVGFVLGDGAVKAALQTKLSKSVIQLVKDAPRYPEGTGIRLLVKKASDLSAIRKLASIKLAN